MQTFIRNIRYPKLIVLCFGGIILLGTFLLMLPISSQSGSWTPFVDALLTAASANCVTGLIVYDTYTHWTLFGQIIILFLIQIGGVGFMAAATILSLLLKRKIGLHERILLQEAAGSTQLGGVVRLTRRILLGTLLLEGIGALLLALRFCPQMGFGQGLYYAIFHSISAFCNAGFDLMGRYEQFSSLTTMADDPYVLLVIAALIVIGGIGFLVWDDLLKNKWHWSRYLLHTKVVLAMTLALIIFGSVLNFVAEGNASMHDMTLIQRIVHSLFQSISPRTAGFNSVDLASLSNTSVLTTVLLMMIGGAPGSTAGGLKVTTMFVMVAAVFATLKGQGDITAFNRKIDDNALKKACSIAAVYISISITGIICISLSQDLPFTSIVFEVFSAIGTVGLSLGITPDLDVFPKLIIVVLMYFGRIGVLSILFAFLKEQKPSPLQYPKEKLIIG